MTLCDPLPEASPAALALPEGVPPLTTFYLYLTDGCNLHCRHCELSLGVTGEVDFQQVWLSHPTMVMLRQRHTMACSRRGDRQTSGPVGDEDPGTRRC